MKKEDFIKEKERRVGEGKLLVFFYDYVPSSLRLDPIHFCPNNDCVPGSSSWKSGK